MQQGLMQEMKNRNMLEMVWKDQTGSRMPPQGRFREVKELHRILERSGQKRQILSQIRRY